MLLCVFDLHVVVEASESVHLQTDPTTSVHG